jgi:hypothetical protein
MALSEQVEETFWFLPDPGCFACIEHWRDEPMLVAAFASVGIEHAMSTGQMAEQYFRQYHEAKHADPRAN